MTGFGSSEGVCCNTSFRVTVRSVNHRYCDINVRVPEALGRVEQKIRDIIVSKFSRGKFDVSISQIDAPVKGAGPGLDVSAILHYKTTLQELSKIFNVKFKLRDDIGLADIAAIKNIVSFQGEVYDNPEIDRTIAKIVSESLNDLMKMRLREGRSIYKDLKRRVHKLESMIMRIDRKSPVVVRSMKKRYVGRIKDLSGITKLDARLDMDRLYQEVAMMVQRMDITEEIVRVGSHIAQLKTKLDDGAVVGRGLDFLLQEINREVNTIASKASDPKISQTVVDMKVELERIREQVQNIE